MTPDPDLDPTVLGPASRNVLPYWRWAGFVCREMRDGRAAVAIEPVGPQHRGGRTQAINGAIQASLLDCAMAVACGSLWLGVPNDRHRMFTVTMTVSFLRPLFGDECVARAIVLGGGKQILFGQAEVRDTEGSLCTAATGTYRIWPGGPMVAEIPRPAR